MIRTINPATGELLQIFDALGAEDVSRCTGHAAEAVVHYRNTTFGQRAGWLRRAADILVEEKYEFGTLMTTEMGKPITAAVSEAEKCALACRFYADHAERMLAPEPVTTEGSHSQVVFEPLGVVLAIMPWNFPFWQVFRFAAPALMAGNVGLLKHASNVPQCALAIQDLLRRAGFPDGVFQTLLVGSDAVEPIIRDPRVAAVTLTGSDAAGAAVGKVAGEVLKKTVFELGGSDPFVVMPSTELDRAVKTAIQARVVNNGQSCIAAKRFVVHWEVFREFTDRFVAGMQALRVGDPMDEQTQVGPLATEEILMHLDEQVQKTVTMGARVLTGGRRRDGAGNYYLPTVLADVPLDCPAAREELFGPVAALFEARDLDDAVRIANDTPFGLGAAAWTRDRKEEERLVRELQAGTVVINGMVASDPRLPFGGVKRSGYGRELSTFGIREFVNVKAVQVMDGGGGRSEVE